jgi:alanyl-tRNA synthetase
MSLRTVSNYSVVAAEVANVPNVEALRDLAIKVRDQVENSAAVVALAAAIEGKPAVAVVANSQAQEHGAKAGDLVRLASKILGGGGGGKADIAQGGGIDTSKIDEALQAIVESLR